MELNGFFAALSVPPGPPFPEEIHGHKMCAVVWCWTGDPEDLGDVLARVNEPGPPAFHFTTPMPYPALQTMFDELIPKGLQWYWRGHFFDRITDGALDVHLKYAENLPTGLSTMHLYPIDGAAARVGKDDTAWAYRDAVWSGVIGGIDPDPANAELIRQWAVDYWEELRPHSMGGTYVNFIGAGRTRTGCARRTATTTTGLRRSRGRTTRTTSSTPTRTSPPPPPAGSRPTPDARSPPGPVREPLPHR